VVNEGRRVIERRGEIYFDTSSGDCEGMRQGWFTGLQRWGAQLSGTGKGLPRLYICIYIYISRYGRCCNALSDVSTTKLPLVKLPVDDTLDLVFLSETSVSLHFTGGEGELFMFYEDCQ